ncbi:hypothetical protein IX317_002148 [Fusobacterium sp. DD29]|uniref:hypothetical protein n=1 Tax=unclassified Fusobacterium TaxID=2648384 RepID=UPI001DF11AEE|nr:MULTISPECIES: hypothetical protein [unclassified Fusobacterium]MBR8701163.1 hypothetical protein [Fusobacterium sp. DD45]MBR8711324.1 hypothetical protein [Fusobacterium sp. DD28]MBR8750426.1 hypothetical protein [Fusobacterium sp. DD29]MBR8751873.1 hypothetical protein [Fusobacterium sp. DD26]MBR8762672.1 hypothetical protein [Fusobacterium sp. DD25]
MKEKILEKDMEDKYITVLGDTWDSIAYKLYNNSLYFDKLMELNPQYHGVIIFNAGMTIKYTPTDLSEQFDIAPWRR